MILHKKVSLLFYVKEVHNLALAGYVEGCALNERATLIVSKRNGGDTNDELITVFVTIFVVDEFDFVDVCDVDTFFGGCLFSSSDEDDLECDEDVCFFSSFFDSSEDEVLECDEDCFFGSSDDVIE